MTPYGVGDPGQHWFRRGLYLNQCWLTINEVLWHSFQGDVYLHTQRIISQVLFEMYIFEITVSREHWANMSMHSEQTDYEAAVSSLALEVQ